MIREIIPVLLENNDLGLDQARVAMREIMSGEATPAQTAAFLVGLKTKGETVEEVTAMAGVMRDCSRRISPKVNGYLLDTCGTGGDGAGTFNVSTTSALVIAGSGMAVAKHGNRSFTSRCGSADVLESLGLNLEMSPETVELSIETLGFGFMYAPVFHPAMARVAPLRREIGVRTVFNILGPLTNPAGASAQLLGVYDPCLLDLMCLAARNLGCRSVMTVHAVDGIDEISVTGKTLVTRLNGYGIKREEDVNPEDVGLKRARMEDISGSVPEENAKLTARILSGKTSSEDARTQMVLLNAAAGLVLCEKAVDLRDGIELAKGTLEDGRAFELLRNVIRLSKGSVERLNRIV